MHKDWGFAAKVGFLSLLFLAGYGLASAQYVGTISSLVGSTPRFFENGWTDYYNGVVSGISLTVFIGMIAFMPASVRRYLKGRLPLTFKKNAHTGDTLSC